MIEFIEIDNIEYINNTDYIQLNDITVEKDHSYIVNDICVHNCTTASSTGIYYGLASLIDECNTIKRSVDYIRSKCPEIIADGGIRTYNDAITALALGADFVMIGTTFASLFESAADFQNAELSDNLINILYRNDDKSEEDKIKAIAECKVPIYKRVYGMSTYVAQKEIDNSAKKRLTEGLGRDVICYKTVKQWVEEFKGYLQSCMSYCNCTKLDQFIGNVECRIMSPNTNGFNNSIDNFVNNDLYIIKE